MNTAEQLEFISVKSYLAAEEVATQKNEYVSGWIRSMSGATVRHNLTSANVIGLFWNQLRGKPCKPYPPDMKIRIRRNTTTWFYYSDAMVVCDSNPPTEHFQDQPVVIVEVLSPSTRAIDFDEKFNNYLSIDSLQVFILFEQDKPQAIVMRRTPSGFLREVYEGIASVIQLPTIGCVMGLQDVYDGVEFPPVAVREDEADYHSESELATNLRK